MRNDEETAALRRGIRGDLIIAVCALVISTAATAASWWQSRVVAEQLSAQVWPYLSIQTNFDSQALSVDVTNDGLGPAIVRSAVLSIDGKPMADPPVELLKLIPHSKGKRVGLYMDSLGAGDVIRASSSRQLFRLTGPDVVPIYSRNAQRIGLAVCYCSLLEHCWQIASDREGDPTPVPHCPTVGKAQFKVPLSFYRPH